MSQGGTSANEIRTICETIEIRDPQECLMKVLELSSHVRLHEDELEKEDKGK